MKTSIKKTLAVAALALSSSLFMTNSYALSIGLTGSSSIGSSGAAITGIDLSNPDMITVTNPKYGLNNGDYSPIPTDTVFTLTNTVVDPSGNSVSALKLDDVSTWNITGPASIGTYTISELVIIAQSADFLNIFTRGIFTPGSLPGNQPGGCATDSNTCKATDTSLRWTFSRSSDGDLVSVSAGGTLASPAIPLVTTVPEPASLGLLSIGLLGCMVSRRKSAKKATVTTQEGLPKACA